MHPNPAFRKQSHAQNVEMARKRGFGVLAVNNELGPLVSHVPFLLDVDGDFADLHLVRSNPIARMNDAPCVIAVSGADGYVSPDWYGVDDQVPTWNYVAVHLRGTLRRLPDDALEDLLNRQSAFFENRLSPKRPWTSGKMSDGVMQKMMRAIVPFRLCISAIEGTWKLGQNKSPDVQAFAADQIEDGTGAELGTLADLMRGN